ncbi:rhomboid family intramembrane serine protease [Schlesneria paludicola]|uniref:rhomboid family intramembrane serine protease n=1 Tax=Schlesneria paludicola TaxID=360056 RepID=UPI0002F0F860|nr:rhomboid family intramembrane serine protease [Schlesneria paludicola]
MRWIRVAPVTAEVVIVCVALYLGCVVQSMWSHERLDDAQRIWGAIQSRTFFDLHDGIHRVPELELNGPFDIWEGEWWRIPLSSFHHDDLFVLVLNLGVTGFLGLRLEKYWGHFSYAMFLVVAVCLPTMAELAVGHASNGLFGVNAAMFGAFVVLREFDRSVGQLFSLQAAYLGLCGMLLAFGVQVIGGRDLPVLSLLVGLCYGAVVGVVFGGPLKRFAMARVALVLLHFCLVPAMWSVVHPTWSGRYFWYRAVTTRDLEQSERRLERAIHCDPSLTAVWLRWSQSAELRHDPLEAWSRLVRGLLANPSSSPLMEGTRRLWRRLGVIERTRATEILDQSFGQLSGRWLAQIRSDGVSVVAKKDGFSEDAGPPVDLREFALDQKLELPDLDVFTGCLSGAGSKAPIEQDEAVEGKTL